MDAIEDQKDQKDQKNNKNNNKKIGVEKIKAETLGVNPKHRRRAREFLVQALYQWHMAGGELADLQAQFIASNDYQKVEWAFFSELLTYVLKNLDEIDPLIEPLLSKGSDSLKPVERAILRAGLGELKLRLDVPTPVVIHEYVDLAFEFGCEQGHKLINGILDATAKRIRI